MIWPSPSVYNLGNSEESMIGGEVESVALLLSERSHLDDELLRLSPLDAIAALIAEVRQNPSNRDALFALGLCAIEVGQENSGANILVWVTRRLIFHGRLLEGLLMVQQGLDLAPENPPLKDMLLRIHAMTLEINQGSFHPQRGVPGEAPSDAELEPDAINALPVKERCELASKFVESLIIEGDPMIPLPVPLLSELKENSFVMMVRYLQYRRVEKGRCLLEEGDKRDSIIIVVSGHINVSQNGQHLQKVGPGIVLGESGLLTRETRPVSAHAHEEAEYFELTRLAVREMARANTRIVMQLQNSFNKQIRGNILNTAPLFKLFEDFAEYMLIEDFKTQHFDRDQIIIEPGETRAPLMIVASGTVDLLTPGPGGELVLVERDDINTTVGSLSHPCEEGVPVTARARTRVTALTMTPEQMDAVLGDHPRAKAYLEELSGRRFELAKEAQAGTLEGPVDEPLEEDGWES